MYWDKLSECKITVQDLVDWIWKHRTGNVFKAWTFIDISEEVVLALDNNLCKYHLFYNREKDKWELDGVVIARDITDEVGVEPSTLEIGAIICESKDALVYFCKYFLKRFPLHKIITHNKNQNEVEHNYNKTYKLITRLMNHGRKN